MTHCSHCGGHVIPSQFKGEPDVCMLCGRDGRPPIPAETARELKMRERANTGYAKREKRESIRAEFAGIEPLEPRHKGRPPGSKNKRSVAMEATA